MIVKGTKQFGNFKRGVNLYIPKRRSAAAPSGIPYSSTASVSIDVINFTLSKENDYGDGNILYQFDESYDTPPRPANYYAFNAYDSENGTGYRAILAFNTSATTYYSNQSFFAPDVSLPQNAWILIVFTAGSYDDGAIPPVPTSVYVNNSSGQSASTIPTSGWTPTITITAGGWISTHQANSIILQSGDSFFGDNGCDFYKQSLEYFGDCGDVKLVFEGVWRIRGDNQTLRYYNSSPNQTANYFPRDNWYTFDDTLTPLVFVAT